MKIKKIPFPKVEDVLCAEPETTLSCELGSYTWDICIDHDGYNLCFYISQFKNNVWTVDGVRTAVREDAPVATYNTVIRKWYEMACEEQQELFEEEISYFYLED